MSGGLSKDGVLPQLQSDILQIPLAQQEEKETTLIGAAAVCAKNMGYDVDACQQNLKLYTPKISAQDAILKYQRWRQFFDWAIKQNF
jgi:glycerol kinase